jgi:dephospho-CoA kinase
MDEYSIFFVSGIIMSQRIIGVTGGIATGKTTVSDYLHQTYGLPVLDADVYAREAVQGEILDRIIERYGAGILDDSQIENPSQNRSLNRRKLGEIVFRDPPERKWLEGLIHPYVRDRFKTFAQQYQPNTLVMVIPLLFEAKLQALVTEIWVVACDPDLELARLMQRNQLSEREAKQRIQSQMPLSEKILLADVVLDNNQTAAELFEQVDAALFNSPYGFSAVPS